MKSFDTNLFIDSIHNGTKDKCLRDNLTRDNLWIIMRSIHQEIKKQFLTINSNASKFSSDLTFKKLPMEDLFETSVYREFMREYPEIHQRLVKPNSADNTIFRKIMKKVTDIELLIMASNSFFPQSIEEYNTIEENTDYRRIRKQIRVNHDQQHLTLLEMYGINLSRSLQSRSFVNFITEERRFRKQVTKWKLRSQCPHVKTFSFNEAVDKGIM